MKLKDWLIFAESSLKKVGIGSARLDALILLEDCLGQDRSKLLAEPQQKIVKDHLRSLNKALSKRKSHLPLAYIRGYSEFYGHKFIVNRHVLEPRPESEDIIDLLLQLNLPEISTVVDVGTGSGVLALSLKSEIPSAQIIATDINPEALKVARRNAKKLQAQIRFLKGDLLEPLIYKKIKPDVVMANLPYVPNKYKLNKAAHNEPANAIFGGSDGLDYYRQMANQLHSLLKSRRYILTESLPFQHAKMISIFGASSYSHKKTQGFVQLFQANV